VCGIVGLFFKDDRYEARLGELLSPMLTALADRGPDSTGFAIYGSGSPDRVKITVHSPSGANPFERLGERMSSGLDLLVASSPRSNHCLLSVPSDGVERALAWLVNDRPDLHVVGAGSRMEIYKEIGRPEAVVARFDLAKMRGTHAIGHTRMATESAVTTNGAHPFSTGLDLCLVHNGSLSNHNSLRRMLMHDGLTFDTENDTEVAAAYLTWRMRQGTNMVRALEASLADLDGFFTFVVGSESGFGVLRDPIACKPAVMAETESYVAFGTEYRALVSLPGIERAQVWEPEPAKVYFWERGQ
jgi:methylamine---glutamate N-methyltransferase subunit A